MALTWPLMIALLHALAAPHAAVKAEEIGWQQDEHLGLSIETSAAPMVGALLGSEGNPLLGGIALTIGARYSLWDSHITTAESYIAEPVLGDQFGLDLNVYGFVGAEGPILMLGLDAAQRNILGNSTGAGRFEMSSVAEVLVPEVGVALRLDDEEDSLFLGWHFAARYLVRGDLALGARAGLQILYPEAGAQALTSIALSVSFR